jgi:hypothetical protein
MPMLKNRVQRRLTADKRLYFTSPKLPSATSFVRKTFNAMLLVPEVKEAVANLHQNIEK